MGEMADFYIDQAIESGAWFRPYSAPRPIVCNRCGARRLWWLPEQGGRHTSMNPDGTPHTQCRVAQDSDFEDLTNA